MSSVTNKSLFKDLTTILNKCQDSRASHNEQIKKCQKLFKESKLDEFFKHFTIAMQGVMITMVKNPNIDRIIEFIALFASSLSLNQQNKGDVTLTESRSNALKTNEQMEVDQSDEPENQFLVKLLDYLIENNVANSDSVRYRCCQILSKLMSAINNEEFIDEDLYDRLSDSLLIRLKDVNSRVQVQAIAAIYRLQDPNDRDCRIMKALVFLLTYDPNWQVRYQALSHVAFSKTSLPEIIDRVRDPNPMVRRKALVILSEKVLIKFINIEKRLFILNYSLKDEDKGVLDICCKKLLPSWLALKENDLCKLLKALDVVDSTDTILLMLNKMHSSNSFDSIVGDFVHNLNENQIIPLDKLTAESVLYWSWVCSKCKEYANDNIKENTLKVNDDVEQSELNEKTQIQTNENEEFLDRLLPSLTEFCNYINQAIKKFDKERLEKPNDTRLHIENSFVLKQLVKMILFVDFGDVHGKKTLEQLCHDLFANRNYTFLFESIMNVYKVLIPNLQTRINNIVELISDLKEPQVQQNQDQQDQQQQHMNTNDLNLNDNHDTSMVAPNNQPKLSPHEINLKISELKFRRLNLKDDFDNLYKEIKNVEKQIDMHKLTELRTQIKECEDEISNLQSQLNGSSNTTPSIASTSASTNNPNNSLASNNQQQQQPEQQLPPYDPIESAYHCLHLSICLLQDMDLKSLTPQLRSLCDTLITPNISSVNEELRAMSVKALNLLCILKLEIAQKFVPLLLNIIQSDRKEVVIEAFKTLINCIMAYSFNKLVNIDSNNPGEGTEFLAEATGKILAVMTSLLDHEDSEIYTVAVEGFCKLYMTGHIISAKLFSKLLIMYYSPLTEDDVRLKSCLSTFLPSFAFFRSVNQLCVEESFMITLKCLINAPTDNYLCEIDLFKVIDILFHLTNPKNLLNRKSGQQTNICHENIVKSVCYEILKDENAFKAKTYLKVLSLADLSLADYYSLKDIYQLANEVHDHISDKLIKKTAKKFAESVQEILVKKPEFREDDLLPNDQTKATEDNNETHVAKATVLREDESDEEDSKSSSSDLIDHNFRKLNKRTNSAKPGSKKTNSTDMSNTTANTTKNTTNNEKLGQTTNQSVLDKTADITVIEKQPTKEAEDPTVLEETVISNRRSSPRKSLHKNPVTQTSKSKITIEKTTKQAEDTNQDDENKEETKKTTSKTIQTASSLSSKATVSPRTKEKYKLKEVALLLNKSEVDEHLMKRQNRKKIDVKDLISSSSDEEKEEKAEDKEEPIKLRQRSVTRSLKKQEATTSNSEQSLPKKQDNYLKPTERQSRMATRRSQSAISQAEVEHTSQDEEPPAKLARKVAKSTERTNKEVKLAAKTNAKNVKTKETSDDEQSASERMHLRTRSRSAAKSPSRVSNRKSK